MLMTRVVYLNIFTFNFPKAWLLKYLQGVWNMGLLLFL
jgi:hypothetical protein